MGHRTTSSRVGWWKDQWDMYNVGRNISWLLSFPINAHTCACCMMVYCRINHKSLVNSWWYVPWWNNIYIHVSENFDPPSCPNATPLFYWSQAHWILSDVGLIAVNQSTSATDISNNKHGKTISKSSRIVLTWAKRSEGLSRCWMSRHKEHVRDFFPTISRIPNTIETSQPHQIHTKYPQDPYYDRSSSFQNYGNSSVRPPPGWGPLSYPNNDSFYTTLRRSRQATHLPVAC